MMVLNCDGGLCNRLRAIDAAVEFSKAAQQPLKVIWHINKGLNCPYEELFEKPIDFEIINSKWFHYTGQPRHHKNILRKYFLIGLEKIFYGKVFYEFDKFNPDISTINPVTLKGLKNIYITNSNNFLKTPRTYHFFKPIPAIQKIIDTYSNNFPSQITGVHIRRTDNSESINNSTDIAFEKKMKKAIEINNSQQFFLATDSSKTEEAFKNEFKNAIITYPKVFGRDNKNGIVDAVVDLFLLAKTKNILASYYSSFSEAAAAIGNIPLEIVK